MPQILTLKKRPEFLRVARQKTQWVTPSMIVQGAPSPEGIFDMRVGYTATKKLGGAVARNRAKRRLREVVRLALPDIELPVCDLVLIARSAALTASFDQLQKDFTWALKHLQRIQADENNKSD